MERFSDQRIILGVTGGIAAYKSAELIRLLTAEGATVRVVMTQSATAFVTPLTFQALSGNPVHTELLDADQENAMGHIHLARWADRILVAPATANFIAKIRLGGADDLLSALCLAADVPLWIAPAMNRGMWENPATQENIRCLEERGVGILGPDQGAQACGEHGYGRMLEPVAICDELASCIVAKTLSGIAILVTAGPTREAIDPVRYLTNRSSGKMGFAIARAAAEAGASVKLITGPVALAEPNVDQVVHVESASQMYDHVIACAADYDIYIGAAAVSDYAPVVVENEKIKKDSDQLKLSLEKTKDILAEVAAMDAGPFTVGFAAETDNLEDYALKKLEAKSLDMIAANWVGRKGHGFDAETNALQVFWRGGSQLLELAAKRILARRLIELVVDRFKHSCN